MPEENEKLTNKRNIGIYTVSGKNNIFAIILTKASKLI